MSTLFSRRLFILALVFSTSLVSAQTTGGGNTATTTASASAASMTTITFPIPELGNCASKQACKNYCEDTGHQDACFSFAESHGMMSKDETTKARALRKIKGPGGCTGVVCKTYCDDTAHTSECIAFAKEHNLIAPPALKVLETIEKNGGPGGCKTKDECAMYCSDQANRVACRIFAQEHELAPGQLLQKDKTNNGVGAQATSTIRTSQIKAVLQINGGPGGCKTEIECKTYCSDTAHQEQCVTFGKEHGLISVEEAKHAEIIRQTLKTSGGPGGCTDTDSCKTFCSEEANKEVCQNFAKEHNILPRPDTVQNMMQVKPRIDAKVNVNGSTTVDMQIRNQKQNPEMTPRPMLEQKNVQMKPLPNALPNSKMTPEQIKRYYEEYKQMHPQGEVKPSGVSPAQGVKESVPAEPVSNLGASAIEAVLHFFGM